MCQLAYGNPGVGHVSTSPRLALLGEGAYSAVYKVLQLM